MTLIMISWCLMLSMNFIVLNHPVSLGSILLFQTILVCLMTGTFFNSYWFSYMLFLIMVGGMLVLFLYMTSVASNEEFNFPIYLKFFNNFMLIISLSLGIFIDPHLTLLDTNLSPIFDNEFYEYAPQLSMNKLMNLPLIKVFFIIISFLLMTLIATIKITSTMKGPLRQSIMPSNN